MIRTNVYKLAICIVLLTACKKQAPTNNPITYGSSFVLTMYTDKALYNPGEEVKFTLNKSIDGAVKVRYRHLAETITETALSGTSWTWKTPAADYTGYMADIYAMEDGKEKIYASIGIDVSSDWARFPRYGFLTNFGQVGDAVIDANLKKLNRHHINGIQYYDWQYKHHWPLGGTAAAPLNTWKDISNKDVYLATVKSYIDKGHDYGIKSMFYNLAFGALSDAATDGVQEQWYAFKDKNHSNKDRHALPQPYFKSDIFVTDAGNANWQNYIASKNKDVYATLNFDGYHVDALGDRGSLYNYNGDAINQAATFKPFLQAMKTASPNKRLVMNAVNQYGQQGNIAESPVDFLYTEVWGPNDNFSNLADIILNNNLYGNGKKTILAAYMNYDHADNTGYFNTPAVLMTDAVMMAFGASHLELGEHMLAKEYFPNNNLQMTDALKISIMHYYDFQVAYENLLRDGGDFNTPATVCTNGKLSLNNWPAVIGKVSVIGKEFPNRQVIHFINFTNANSLQWRDTKATQTTPNTIENADLTVTATKPVKKVWMASPDINSGVAMPITFTQTGNQVSITLPSLQYWDMLVLEY